MALPLGLLQRLMDIALLLLDGWVAHVEEYGVFKGEVVAMLV